MQSNRTRVWRLATAALLLGLTVTAAEVPHAEISNGLVKALIYLPDAQRGYYRGVRFDWSGVVASLTYQGHEFFGQWFANYDPLLHDAIMGPVEEFRSQDGALGYAKTKPQGIFMKIGVGTLRKPDNDPYNFARTYPLVNPGHRVVRAESDHIDFIHELNDGEGYAYKYTKTLRLSRAKPELILDHVFKNTGRRIIDTDVYNHDFFMLDHLPTGPDIRVKFLFEPKPVDQLMPPALIEGNDIRYGRELQGNSESAYGALSNFGANDIRVENSKAGIGVREVGDKPLSKLFFWSTRTTVCPEAYIHMHIEPGKTFKWRITYSFYLIQ